MIENEDSIFMASRIYGYILALKANTNCNIGMIKIHLETIAKFLKEKFSQFKEIIGEKDVVMSN
jgi:predicted regulator of Ras-like GTPase activity (Roadblock/LC7/MglB family)